MLYATYLKLHVRHQDNSFNPRYLETLITAHSIEERDQLYQTIFNFLTRKSDELRSQGAIPQEIYEFLIPLIKSKYNLNAYIVSTPPPQNTHSYLTKTVHNTDFNPYECTWADFQNSCPPSLDS